MHKRLLSAIVCLTLVVTLGAAGFASAGTVNEFTSVTGDWPGQQSLGLQSPGGEEQGWELIQLCGEASYTVTAKGQCGSPTDQVALQLMDQDPTTEDDELDYSSDDCDGSSEFELDFTLTCDEDQHIVGSHGESQILMYIQEKDTPGGKFVPTRIENTETKNAYWNVECIDCGEAVKCKGTKLKTAGKKASRLVRAFGKNNSKPNEVKLAVDISRAQSRYTKDFARAEERYYCLTTADAEAIQEQVDVLIDDLLAELGIGGSPSEAFLDVTGTVLD